MAIIKIPFFFHCLCFLFLFFFFFEGGVESNSVKFLAMLFIQSMQENDITGILKEAPIHGFTQRIGFTNKCVCFMSLIISLFYIGFKFSSSQNVSVKKIHLKYFMNYDL